MTDLEMTTPAPTTAQTVPSAQQENFPTQNVLKYAAKFAIEQDKAIMLDYFMQSLSGGAYLCEDPTSKEKVLMKTKEEYTSLIKKLHRLEGNLIIQTENSIYIVSERIKKLIMPHSSLQDTYDA